jgi:hypothetical protein
MSFILTLDPLEEAVQPGLIRSRQRLTAPTPPAKDSSFCRRVVRQRQVSDDLAASDLALADDFRS